MIQTRKLHELSQFVGPIGDPFLDGLYNNDNTAIYYRFLYQLSKFLQPQKIIELGVYHGWSTAHLAAPVPKALVMAIDPSPQEGFRNTTNHYQNIAVILDRSDSQGVLDMVAEKSVDICFIDTIHEYEQASKELKLWTPKMKSGGVFLYDDITQSEGMKKFWNEVPEPKISMPWLHHSGFGASIVS
jgi:predicted O-methyltransferase YrrM